MHNKFAKMPKCRWNSWNEDHATQHGIEIAEIEYLVSHAQQPYPERARGGTFLVRGQSEQGHYIQVVFVPDPEDTVFVIHARPLTPAETRQFRRRTR
jgi:uncharacterized DUF497 family protein